MQNEVNRTTNPSAPAGVAAAAAQARIPERSYSPGRRGLIAEMARRDLEATLQLLAERARFISDAAGAAIALRQGDHSHLRCCATAGEKVPEQGTLFSTEMGLSGECVRTRMPLRCDDTQSDPRVNSAACRQLGIASIAVMPIVSDEQVVGIFELFSGAKNAFGERDLASLQRLGQMVETAVKLEQSTRAVTVDSRGATEDDLTAELESADHQSMVVESSKSAPPAETRAQVDAKIAGPAKAAEPDSEPTRGAAGTKSRQASKLLWTAAMHAEPALPEDRSQVPAALRDLHQCQACGFPVSHGRTLCVECEEKSWKGQLRPKARSAPPVAPVPPASSNQLNPPRSESAEKAGIAETKQAGVKVDVQQSDVGPPAPASSSITASSNPESAPEFALLRAGTESESWISTHKYILIVIALVAVMMAALILSR